MARLTDTVVSTITDTFFIAHNFWREISQTLNKEVSPYAKTRTRQPDRRVCGQRREWPRVRTSACWSWITSPIAKCVYGLCAFAEVFFSCSHTVLPKEHILGVLFFFSSLSSCYAVIFFNSLSSCPVYPLVIYVCYVWAG